MFVNVIKLLTDKIHLHFINISLKNMEKTVLKMPHQIESSDNPGYHGSGGGGGRSSRSLTGEGRSTSASQHRTLWVLS